MYRFTITQTVENYTHVDDDYRKVEVTQNFECGTFDELSNLLLTLVDYSYKDITVKIHKEEVPDV